MAGLLTSNEAAILKSAVDYLRADSLGTGQMDERAALQLSKIWSVLGYRNQLDLLNHLRDEPILTLLQNLETLGTFLARIVDVITAISPEFVTSESLGTLRNDFTGFVGMKVTVGASPIVVTHLGRWIVPLNNDPHVLKITDADTCGAVIGSSVVVNTNGFPINAFRYSVLEVPVILAANTSFYIWSQEVSGGDSWYDLDTGLTHTTAAVVNGPAFNDGTCNLQSSDTDHSYGPVSFKYLPIP